MIPAKTYQYLKDPKKLINTRFIIVAADNSFYKPYDILYGEIVEVWQYASGIFPEDFEPEYLESLNVKEMLFQIRKDIQIIDDKISKND